MYFSASKIKVKKFRIFKKVHEFIQLKNNFEIWKIHQRIVEISVLYTSLQMFTMRKTKEVDVVEPKSQEMLASLFCLIRIYAKISYFIWTFSRIFPLSRHICMMCFSFFFIFYFSLLIFIPMLVKHILIYEFYRNSISI